MAHSNNEGIANEETPLLSRPKPNPLPWFQISIVLLLQVAEPLTSLSIYPYITQLVSELDITGGDHRKVGYYAGMIESLFFVAEAMTVLHWSRLSDQIGRKPILLIGLFGVTVSTLSFGLSRTFWGLVVSRCMCGLLNGNVGVMKSVMGDLTDSTNRAEGFSLMPMVWAAGATLGPLIGGTLTKPADRFPGVFRATFWKEYPYFLPCLVPAALVLIAFIVTLVFFKETVHHKKLSLKSSASEETLINLVNEPVPLRHILVYPVVLSIANYMSLAFLNICLDALLPLFLAMPLTIGGLGFDPATIGYVMGFYGICTGIFQALFFAKIVRRMGERAVFVAGISVMAPIFALFPLISITAHYYGVTTFTWACLILMVLLMVVMDMAFGCIFVYITASSPSKRSLGATNGLSQTAVSIIRAVGPALANSLFSVSVEHDLLWGYAVYAILFGFTVLAIGLALCLPHQVWTEVED
ncbi:hypothetical protein H0H92_007876 [Tricholoma furcatifolium]|nr:hypothetical protein H0H92_007876 [Tricholoma furcatifolium]